jgi:hypothetical protein
MRTSGILTLGGAVVAFLGGLFALLMARSFLIPTSEGRFPSFVGLLFGVAIVAAGVGALVAGRKRAKVEEENDERGFAEAAQALARKGSGQVGLDAVCKATGLSSDEAQVRMRRLTGKGLFELDFDANGQMVYKLSTSVGAAQLAEFARR